MIITVLQREEMKMLTYKNVTNLAYDATGARPQYKITVAGTAGTADFFCDAVTLLIRDA